MSYYSGELGPGWCWHLPNSGTAARPAVLFKPMSSPKSSSMADGQLLSSAGWGETWFLKQVGRGQLAQMVVTRGLLPSRSSPAENRRTFQYCGAIDMGCCLTRVQGCWLRLDGGVGARYAVRLFRDHRALPGGFGRQEAEQPSPDGVLADLATALVTVCRPQAIIIKAVDYACDFVSMAHQVGYWSVYQRLNDLSDSGQDS